jgi:chromosome segregation ATPase
LGDWQAATARLTNDLARLDQDLAQRHDAAIERAAKLGVMSEASSLRLAQAEARLEAIAMADVAVSGAMDTRLEAIERRLSETDKGLERLTETSVRLLDLIQSSARHSRETLQPALNESEERLVHFETRVQSLRNVVVEAGAQGEMLAQRIVQVHGAAHGVSDALSAQDVAIGGLREQLTQVESEALRIASDAKGELGEAIRTLGGTVMQMLGSIESEGASRVTALADQLSTESGIALERAMRLKASEITGQLEQAASHALGISREAAHQLRDQLREVETVIANIEPASPRPVTRPKTRWTMIFHVGWRSLPTRCNPMPWTSPARWIAKWPIRRGHPICAAIVEFSRGVRCV